MSFVRVFIDWLVSGVELWEGADVFHVGIWCVLAGY